MTQTIPTKRRTQTPKKSNEIENDDPDDYCFGYLLIHHRFLLVDSFVVRVDYYCLRHGPQSDGVPSIETDFDSVNRNSYFDANPCCTIGFGYDYDLSERRP